MECCSPGYLKYSLTFKKTDDLRRRIVYLFLLFGITASAVTFVWIQRVDSYLQDENVYQASLEDDVNNIGNRILSRKKRQTGCSANETVTSQIKELSSPGYPGNYASNLHCFWVLKAQNNANITLNIVSLNTEEDRKCEYDYLEIFGGTSTLGPSLGRFCGVLKDKIIATNYSNVLVVFHSDPNFEEEGFLLQYYFKSHSGCESTLTNLSGIITSPQFPKNYPDNAECWTRIFVPIGSSINLKFEVLSLEFDENCTYDYVEVYDGKTADDPYLGRFCYERQMKELQSSSNNLLIHFVSDQLLNNKGFQAHYTSSSCSSSKRCVPSNLGDAGECRWIKEKYNGTIASPNYPEKYPSNAKCTFIINAPQGLTITVDIESLQLEIDDKCSYDRLEIWDGIKDAKLLGRFCGKANEAKTVESTGNTINITFVSDSFVEFSGFKATYQIDNINENMDSSTEIEQSEEETISLSVSNNYNYTISPDSAFVEVPANAQIAKGGSHVLRCTAKNPISRIRWLKDEQFLAGEDPLPGLKAVGKNIMWIKNMTKHLEGQYTCASVSTEGVSTAKARVMLEEIANKTPKHNTCNFVMRKIPKDKSVSEDEFFFLECSASGSGINISWEYNGTPLFHKKHKGVVSSGFLVFDRAALNESGIYTCVVLNTSSKCQTKISAAVSVIRKANIDEICGRPHVGNPSREKPILDHGKIVGGNNAKKGAFPWQAMIWEPNRQSFCGGAVLNERWIVTAAHCLVYTNIDKATILIRLGKYNQNINEDREIISRMEDHFIHPDFSKETLDNDIALIRLKQHIVFNDYILPICIGNQKFIEHNFMSKSIQMVTVTGWGQLKQGGSKPQYLQELRIPIVEERICNSSTKYTVTRNMFCAGYAQEIIGDSCKGDSGGPLVADKDGIWFLVGIVSWGEECGGKGKYGFYTKVSNYYQWIKGVIKL